MTETVYVRTNMAVEFYHTTADCPRLQSANNFRELELDQVGNHAELCSWCDNGGPVPNDTPPDFDYQRALKQAAQEVGDD